MTKKIQLEKTQCDLDQKLCCPYCYASLSLGSEECKCTGCGREFSVLLNIPDLRIPQKAWIDYQKDLELAHYLASEYESETFESLVKKLWKTRKSVPNDIVKKRIKQIYKADSKYRYELSVEGWIGSHIDDLPRDDCLELGCGPGGFLVSASRHFKSVIGIDICLAWLIVAKKRLEENGTYCPLICACVERLPLEKDSFDFIASFDVIEHVSDRNLLLEETKRISRSSAKVVFTTPNRFSLSAEPHVEVFGVGFLPRNWMASYVHYRTGRAYLYVYLMSIFELRRLFKSHQEFAFHVDVPEIWEGELRSFKCLKKVFAIGYNYIRKITFIRPIVLLIAPFFQIVIWKRQDEPKDDN